MNDYPASTITESAQIVWLGRIRDWCRGKLGWALEALHAPAKMREFECVDPITSETVYLSTGARYSVLHVGNRRFFFDRITGRFDGAGTLFQERIVDRMQFLD